MVVLGWKVAQASSFLGISSLPGAPDPGRPTMWDFGMLLPQFLLRLEGYVVVSANGGHLTGRGLPASYPESDYWSVLRCRILLHCPVPGGSCGCGSGSILKPSVCPLFMEVSHSPLVASFLKGASKGPFLASFKPSE